jgi:hypothetical protein
MARIAEGARKILDDLTPEQAGWAILKALETHLHKQPKIVAAALADAWQTKADSMCGSGELVDRAVLPVLEFCAGEVRFAFGVAQKEDT